MTVSRTISLLVVCLGTVLAGTAPARTLDIKTAAGQVEVRSTPKKIAVFDIAAIDTLDALGVKIDGVPENLYLPQLEALKTRAEPVGSIFEPNLEALSALAPELIIVGGRSSPQIGATGRVAQSIDMTIYGEDLIEQARDRIDAYGALFGKEPEADEARTELDEALRAASAAVKGKGRALIVMTSGPKVSAYGIGSRFGWVHRALDLPVAAEGLDAANHGEAVSFEFIREVDPDWLIVLDRSAAIGASEQSAGATLDNELVAQTRAWKAGQVIYLPAGDFYIAAGGARATTRVLEAIREGFDKAQ